MSELSKLKHNHITRDIKEFGECAACDDYHKSELILKYKKQLTKALFIIEKQREIIDMDTEAIELYADNENWDTGVKCGYFNPLIIGDDYDINRYGTRSGGKLAREIKQKRDKLINELIGNSEGLEDE